MSSEQAEIIRISDPALYRLTCDIPPVLEVRDYITAHGHGLTAKFDLTGIPPEYHQDFLMLIRIGGCHLAKPMPEPVKPERRQRWWHRVFSPKPATA